MSPLTLLVYCFAFGLLHGILPDEHTWPITFSYAIGGASGKEGIKAGLYFSAAFTFQRMLLSELSYLALAPFLLSPRINGLVYIAVGMAMSLAGAIVLRRNRYPHLHLLGRCREGECETAGTIETDPTQQAQMRSPAAAPPVQWTIIHGFLAGFGLGGFSMFVNVVAAPAMPSPWMGFLPGLVFGLGTMGMLVILGWLFGLSLQHIHSLSGQEIKRIGAQTGGRALLFGGLLFSVFGVAALLGLERILPANVGYLVIALFMLGVAVPAFLWSLKEVLEARDQATATSGGSRADSSPSPGPGANLTLKPPRNGVSRQSLHRAAPARR
jgi:hypothetical protein